MNSRHVIIADDAAQLALKTAEKLVQTAEACVARQGMFTLAISGGTTPRAMHRLLATPAYRPQIPWGQTHVFWVDERCVPVTDPASNYGNARTDFLDQVPIPATHIHRMPGELNPEQAAFLYAETIRETVRTDESGFPVFDLAILGIGPDGHTASLFPGHPALEESARWVMAVKGGNPCVHRLTLTLPVLNHAARIWFMVSGVKKADIVQMLVTQSRPSLPAGRVQPLNGNLTWMLDRTAAGGTASFPETRFADSS